MTTGNRWDLGYFDDDGFLYLSDRRVDMFTVGDHNVYPAEIENALSAHPDMLSCLVVGDDAGKARRSAVRAGVMARLRPPEAD